MTIDGKIVMVGDNVDTDVIIPARYLKGAAVDAARLGAHLMEPLDPTFASRIKAGDVLVAGSNFGCGSSREHAVLAIKGAGIAAVIAKSFARIFFRNAVNQALPVLVCPEAVEASRDGERLRIDFDAAQVEVGGRVFPMRSYAKEVQEIFEAGGLVEYVRRRQAGHAHSLPPTR